MALEEYSRKRNFKETPEPSPGRDAAAAAGRGGVFCVQRHRARRLHYDLRLEFAGVLKSWALPKGPSLSPGAKVLAVQVEDHPLEYASFEGNIPAGNYGAGSVMLWDRGEWELLEEPDASAQLARGDLKFRLRGARLRGAFALVRLKSGGKGNEWLLIKKRDEFADPAWDLGAHARSVLTGRTEEEIAGERPASAAGIPGAVKAPMPASAAPMLAQRAAAPPEGAGWLYEIKWDGVRALCFLERGALRIASRRGNSFTRRYPELEVLTREVRAETAVIDGEIVALDERGRPDFGRLQARIGAAGAGPATRWPPVTLYAFDLLYLDGYDLRGAPLEERKRALRAILSPGERVRYSEHFETSGRELLEAARANALEGIVAKRAGSPYRAGRGGDWLKIKLVNRQEFVVCGFTRGARGPFASLLLGHFERDRLIYSGSVGAGFDSRTSAALRARMEPLVTDACPFAEPPPLQRPTLWLRPELVCEVKFAEWTRQGRLRAPVFVGLRPDLVAADAVRETAGAVEAGRRPLRLTNLDKVFFPGEGYTKRDLLNYYDAVADLILPHLADRPLALKRYPDGIEGEFFFQKDMGAKWPSWLRTEVIPGAEPGRRARMAIADSRAALLYLVNLGCIDHNPWMSRLGSLDHPDFVLIDLDPQEADYGRVVEAALVVRGLLGHAGLRGYPKTSGGGGMHIYVPLAPRYCFEQTRAFAELLAALAARERPDLFTTPRALSRREKGKVYFDYLQNGSGKTISSAYSVRPRAGAPVATPLEWSEVRPGLDPGRFTIRGAPARFERAGDLFRPVLEGRQSLEPAAARLEALARGLRPEERA